MSNNHSGSQDLNRPMDLSGTEGFAKAFLVIFVVGMVLFGLTFGMLLSESNADPDVQAARSGK
jgi:hypothetical protein